MKRSVIAFAIAAALGLLSMGALGALLYWLVSPMLAPFHGDLAQWHGDWVWPATILAGMLWSVSFLAAGALDCRLEAAQVRVAVRRVVYPIVLWIGAVLAWAAVLSEPLRPV